MISTKIVAGGTALAGASVAAGVGISQVQNSSSEEVKAINETQENNPQPPEAARVPVVQKKVSLPEVRKFTNRDKFSGFRFQESKPKCKTWLESVASPLDTPQKKQDFLNCLQSKTFASVAGYSGVEIFDWAGSDENSKEAKWKSRGQQIFTALGNSSFSPSKPKDEVKGLLDKRCKGEVSKSIRYYLVEKDWKDFLVFCAKEGDSLEKALKAQFWLK